jgi:5-methylcytosine-specific restriction protein A
VPRLEFSRKTKRDRFAHCAGKCEGCGVRLQVGRFHYDHDVPTGWMSGDNSFDNCRVLCQPCHADKTSAEAPQKAKSDRIRDKWIGAKTSRTPLPCGRNSPFKKRMDGSVVRRDP